jgi:hypothetical protein
MSRAIRRVQWWLLPVALSTVVLSGCVAATDSNPDPVSTHQPTPHPSVSETPTGGPIATVTIASVDTDGLHASVSGYVTLISEDGGKCTFVLTSGISGEVVSVASDGHANVDSTSCGFVAIPIEKLQKGPWDVVLDYSSASGEFESLPAHLEVP